MLFLTLITLFAALRFLVLCYGGKFYVQRLNLLCVTVLNFVYSSENFLCVTVENVFCKREVCCCVLRWKLLCVVLIFLVCYGGE